MSQTTILPIESFKAAKAHKRTAVMLNLALFAHLEQHGTEAQIERAQRALCNAGTKMMQAKNALPSDPSQLRMHAESIKQKLESILVKTPTDKTTLAHNATTCAVRKECTLALESIKQFIAEYVEHKEAKKAA
jgi:hypothetical protein